MIRLACPALHGDVVRLEPLSRDHAAGLRAAVDVDRSTFAFTRVPRPETVDEYVMTLLSAADAGTLAPFAQVEVATGAVVGHTSFCTPLWGDERLRTVEVGHTFLTPRSQGGALNSESKLLLFTHAFEFWGVERVQLTTDARNQRSRAAITAVGASLEGVLRSVGPSRVDGEEGRLRDTAVFSVVATEWPEVRRRLTERVAARRAVGAVGQQVA